MEIEKTLALQAPPAQVWALLLDPQAMGQCVPGMESIEVVSPDEYTAVMRVKIAFISARFKLRTRIVERREPSYLRAEGTGEDTSVASSLKQQTEMSLQPRPDGGTDLQLKVQVDLQGRMGTFGLSVMKTKADRLWDEFGVNLAARLAGGGEVPAPQPEPSDAGMPAAASPGPAPVSAPVSANVPAPTAAPTQLQRPAGLGWWARLLYALGVQPANAAAGSNAIVVELRRPDGTHLRAQWPATHAEACTQWLRELTR